MESEFLVHVNEESRYIEGLHPIRSKHVVERLHEFLPIDNTAISVMKMADKWWFVFDPIRVLCLHA